MGYHVPKFKYSNFGLNVKDYGAVGNGINDDTQAIQNTIAAASAKGINVVYIPAPKVAYMVNVTTPIIVPSNMVIRGDKGQSILRVIPTTVHNNNDYFFGGINSLFVPGTLNDRKAFTKDAFGSNIHFDGLVVDGNGDAIDQTGFFKEALSFGIKCLYVKNLSITNCETKNFLGAGIYTYGCTIVTIDNNHVHHNGKFAYTVANGYTYANGVNRNGISLAGGYLPGQTIQETPYSYDYIVTNNIVHDNVDEGIMFSYQKRVLIQGNIVHNNGDMGIEGDFGYSTTDTQPDIPGDVIPGDVTIVNNFVYDHPHRAISLSSSNMQKIKISDNIIRNCGEHGIFLQQNSNSTYVITDNLIYNYGYSIDTVNGIKYCGMYIEGHYVEVHDNHIYAPNFDFSVGDGYGGTATGPAISIARAYECSIQDNIIRGGGHTGVNIDIWKMGDLGETMNSLKIEGNKISNVHRQGMYINANLATRIFQVTVSDNSVYNYQHGYDYSGGQSWTLFAGIEFGSNTRITSLTVVGNTVYQDTDNTVIIATGQPLGKKPGQYALNLTLLQDGIVNAVLAGNEFAYGGDFASTNNTDKVQFISMSGNNIFGKRIMYANAVPTGNVKKYYRGDVIFNTLPSSGTSVGWVCTVDGTPGTWVEFGFTKQQRSGQVVYNGDGTTTKTIPHGLNGTPNAYFVQAVSIDAGNAVVKRVTADTTNLTVTFTNAQTSGTGNMTLIWRAEL